MTVMEPETKAQVLMSFTLNNAKNSHSIKSVPFLRTALIVKTYFLLKPYQKQDYIQAKLRAISFISLNTNF